MMSASGIGKSTALAQERDALTAAAACLVDLKELAGKQDPVTYLAAATQMPAQVPGDAWHVLLDSFDEALKRVPNLVELLDQWLHRWDETERGRMRLRLATRPGVLANAALETVLRNHWQTPGSVVVRDMAPLTRDDVIRAAGEKGILDPEGFAAGLEQRGLVPVASLPLPLTALLDHIARGHELPETGEKVYRLACEQLCEEPNPARRRPEGLGLREVMRTAEHLAAVLEFCGNGVLTDGLVTSPDGPVRLVDVAVAAEPGAEGHAERLLSWLTTTPLLMSLSGNQWQFAHQGIQGFLAASYLKDRQLAPASIRSLLFAGQGSHATSTLVTGMWRDGSPGTGPGSSARFSITILRRCSARTCPHSPRLCGRRSSTRCLPPPDAARNCPGWPRCTVPTIQDSVTRSPGRSRRLQYGKPAPSGSPWHWRWRSPEHAQTRLRPLHC